MRVDAASVLLAMGYALDVDFIALDRGKGTEIQWLSKEPMPSESEIDAYKLPDPAVLSQINMLEAKQTRRMVRGAQLGDEESARRLRAIEDEIAALRGKL